MLEDKLKTMRNFEPSAPPLEALHLQEESLQNLHKDIKENGYPEENNKLLAILRQYPEFDVNIKSWHGKVDNSQKRYMHTQTMLDIAFSQESPQLVNAIINNPNISKKDIERVLSKFQHFTIPLSDNYSIIKQMLEDKLKTMRNFEPSAPPLEALHLQEESLQNLHKNIKENDYPAKAKVDNTLKTPSVSDIQNLPTAPTHEPILLPDAPTKAILLPKASTKTSENNANMFSYI
jgi:hypothetical protein